MKTPDIPANERERLEALRRYEILDTPPEGGFDALTELAAHIAGTPIALVSLVDTDRQWFKSRYGLEAPETPRDISFCGHVVATEAPLIVTDAHRDPRFSDNPLVTGNPKVRFYAGVPLRTPDGFVVGTLCTIDHDARELSPKQQEMLGLLAKQVVDQLELRRQNVTLRAQRAALATQNEFFELSLDLLCTADEKLHFRELNPAWEEVLGWTRDELRARPFTDFVHPDDLERTFAESAQLLKGAVTVHFENRYRHKDGSWVPLSWVSAVKEGVFYATARDISVAREKQAELETAAAASRLLAAVVESSDDAIITKTIDGTITSWNEAAARLFGHSEVEALGRPMTMLFPTDRVEEEALLLERLKGGERIAHFETVRLHKDGRSLDVSVTLSPLKDGAGRIVGASKIVRDISDRKRLERMQAEFVSTVSHELRTPLTSIRGSLGLVSAGVTGALPKEAKEYVDIALSNSDRLVRLINDILDMEKMRSGSMDFRMRTLELGSALRSAIDANNALASSHKVRLTLTSAVPLGEVLVDPDRLTQVLTNLISNAVKFSPPEADVELAAERCGDRFRVTVRDHGPGIPDEFRARMFQRFAQADASSTREKGGTGLGLSISKAIIERMHGEIGFEPADGGGTRFFFELPYLAPVTSDRADAGVRQVLVCEDDPDVSRLLARLFGAAGFVVHVAPTLERARRLLALQRYDFITLDLVLADGDGAELIREVRAAAATRSTPIIVVSGSNRRLGQAAILVTDVIEKPFREERLLSAVERALGAARDGATARILHVEDNEDVRRILKRILPQSWTVDEARTVDEAKLKLGEGRYDVVLLDLSLPDGKGEELLGFVGAAQVIIFSASDASSDLARRVSAALVKSRSGLTDVRDLILSLVPKGGHP